MTLEEKVRAFSDEHQLISEGSTLIVGLSGGPDSVALLTLLHNVYPTCRLIAAHLDHQWRKESSKDVTFCRAFTESLSVEFVHTTAQNITLTKKPQSQEDHGRLIRRAYFEELAKEYHASAIALGHHYNDQQETFFLRMIRGASIAGLAAMKPKKELYIRPLLSCTKEELLSYLKDKNMAYVEDETNTDPKYLRNAIRHQVIPALRACDTRFDSSFVKTLKTIQETDAYLDRITKVTLEAMSTTLKGATLLDTKKLLATDEFLQHRLLVHWLCKERVPFTPTQGFFNELMRFLHNQGKEHQLHPSWKLVKSGTSLSIKRT